MVYKRIVFVKSLLISKKLLSNIFYWSAAVFLILIAGFRTIGLDRDSLNYVTYYQSANKIDLLDKEPAFWIIKFVNDILFKGDIRTFFFIFATLGVSIKFFAIKKLSKKPWISVIAYISLYYILHEMTQIRAGVAAGIFLLAIPDIYNKNLKNYLLKTLIAVSFHYSAIIMLPLYFFNPKNIKIIYFSLPVLGLFFALSKLSSTFLINKIVNILPEFLRYKINIYFSLLNNGIHSEINIFNIYYTSLLILLIFIFYILYILKIKLKGFYDIIYVKILIFSLFVFYFFSFIPVFSFRISEFLDVVLIFLIPNLYLYFKQKKIILSFIISYFFILFNFYSKTLLNI